MSSDDISNGSSARNARPIKEPTDDQLSSARALDGQVMGTGECEQSAAVSSDSEKTLTRRKMLLRAGWTVPVIFAAELPSLTNAQTGSSNPGSSNPFHSDNSLGHSDRAFGTHGDETGPDGLHGDGTPGSGHEDASTGGHGDSTEPFGPG
jgi:hypothetical protein